VSYEEQRSEILQALEHDQDELRQAVTELRDAAINTVAVRHWMGERPWAWISVAFALGAWIGFRRGRPAPVSGASP